MQTYIVEPGDNIGSIAKKFNVKVIDLIKENNLENIYYLAPGMELIIPDVSEHIVFDYYVVQKGDNLYQIGKRYGISADMLAEINGLELNEYIYPNQKLLVPKDGIQVYVTKEEDTLKSIADELKISQENIILYNRNIYLLPGQLIAYPVE